MQSPDPFEARERGVRRVRQVTAAVAVAAVAGTGLLTWTLADRAAAAQSPAAVTGGVGDDGETGGFSFDDHVSPPAQLPGFGSNSGPVQASSGGS